MGKKTATQIFEESERAFDPIPVYESGDKLGGYITFIKWNPLTDIVMAEKGIGAWEFRIFMFILCNYDNPTISDHYKIPVSISASELESAYSGLVSAQYINKCIQNLIKSKFLIQVNRGIGKRASTYVPNAPYIHELITQHYKSGKEWFKP